MADSTRRTFLAGAGVAAATAAAVTVAGPAAAALAKGSDDATPSDAPDASTERLVAYVKDAKAGTISIMSGDRETVVTDRALAQKLARLAD